MPESLSKEEKAIQDEAIAFAKKHKKVVAARLTDVDRYIPEKQPVSVFIVDQIDSHIPEKYSRADLERLLKLR
ncbi:MAG: hypothetical protein ACK4SX_10790 [Alcanivoracaceae bacterium]